MPKLPTKKSAPRAHGEWYPSAAEFHKFRPIDEVDPALLQAHREGTLRKRGRPPSANKKELVSLRMDPAVLRALKSKGKGWQTELNRFLRQALVEKRL
jgi:uncharacterized protein (DUF4415 family)